MSAADEYEELPEVFRFTERFGGPIDRVAEMAYRQGVITAWDFLAGTNTVTVDGTPLFNLPHLLGPEAILMRAGDVVSLIQFRSSFFIQGRVSAPSDTRASGKVQQRVLGQATIAAVDPTWDDGGASTGPVVSTYVGSSRRVQITLTAFLQAFGKVGLGAKMGVQVLGPNNTQVVAPGANNYYMLGEDNNGTQGFDGAFSYVMILDQSDGIVEGMHTFKCQYTRTSSGLGSTFAYNRTIIVEPF